MGAFLRALIRPAIVAGTGVAGWIAGLFGSDSVKNLSWFLILAAIAAIIIAAIFWFKK